MKKRVEQSLYSRAIKVLSENLERLEINAIKATQIICLIFRTKPEKTLGDITVERIKRKKE